MDIDLKYEVNLVQVGLSVVFVLLLTKALAFLPGVYYFSFTKAIGEDDVNPFLIQPKSVSLEKYHKYIKEAAAKSSNESVDEINPYDVDINTEEQKVVEKKIQSEPEYKCTAALFFKLLPPFTVGFISIFFFQQSAYKSIPVGAALTAFILCWPVILLWDKIAPGTSYEDNKNLFIILYVTYIALYYHAAKFGCALAGKCHQRLVDNSTFKLEWGKAFVPMVYGSISSFVILIINETIAKP